MSVSEKSEARYLIKMLPERGWNFDGLKALIGNSCSVDRRPPSDRPHTARRTVQIDRVKELAVSLTH